MSTPGFAVKDDFGRIIVNTVHETERGAMVNWLVVEERVAVYADHSDAYIANSFGCRAYSRRHTLVAVTIAEAPKN